MSIVSFFQPYKFHIFFHSWLQCSSFVIRFSSKTLTMFSEVGWTTFSRYTLCLTLYWLQGSDCLLYWNPPVEFYHWDLYPSYSRHRIDFIILRSQSLCSGTSIFIQLPGILFYFLIHPIFAELSPTYQLGRHQTAVIP